jgi:hypothetical protein
VLIYSGSSWTAPERIFTAGALNSISCPASNFCAAVGGNERGFAVIYDGATWRSLAEVDSKGWMESVSCVSPVFCVALAQHGRESQATTYALIYNGAGWSAPAEVDAQGALHSISCVSETFCVAVGAHEAATFNGSSWTLSTDADAEGNFQAVSCASTTFCVAVAEHDVNPGWTVSQGLVYDGSTWSSPSEIPRAPERGPFSVGSISCPASEFCMAAARFEAAAALYESGVWAPWTSLRINGDFISVSCPSMTFCAAVSTAGEVYTYSDPERELMSSTPKAPAMSSAPKAAAGVHIAPAMQVHGRPHVDPKTGRITLRYSFSVPGVVEVFGDMTHQCKGSRDERRHFCLNASLGYRKVRLDISGTPKTYTMRLRPDTKTSAALKRGATLAERIEIVFSQSASDAVLRQSMTVNVKLADIKARKRGRAQRTWGAKR